MFTSEWKVALYWGVALWAVVILLVNAANLSGGWVANQIVGTVVLSLAIILPHFWSPYEVESRPKLPGVLHHLFWDEVTEEDIAEILPLWKINELVRLELNLSEKEILRRAKTLKAARDILDQEKETDPKLTAHWTGGTYPYEKYGGKYRVSKHYG